MWLACLVDVGAVLFCGPLEQEARKPGVHPRSPLLPRTELPWGDSTPRGPALPVVTPGHHPAALLVLISMILLSGSFHLSIHRVDYRAGKALDSRGTKRAPEVPSMWRKPSVATEPAGWGSLSKAARQGQSCVFTSAPISMSSSSLWGSLALRKFVVGTFLFPGRQSVVVSS